MLRALATGLLFALVAVVWTVPSGAHDSESPRGAHHHWLPNEPWSHKHWRG